MKPLNILIVDDEALLREGLATMLEREEFVSEIFQASSGREFQNKMLEHKIDVILLDIRLRDCNALDLLRTMSLHPSQKVIAVTGLDGVELIINLLKLGVQSIVYKLDGYNEIIKSIKAVISGESYFPPNILKIIQSNAKHWEEVPSVVLTFQEKELVKAIATGATTKEIGPRLKMSSATAETYRTRLMKKVGVPNTAALLAYAYKNGIL
jgi:DNA-binding NarL/FixJ family response regulator